MKPDAFGAAPGAAEQTLVIGAGLVQNEKIRTTADGTANVIFADRSTLTVGKGSQVVLDKFVYDPATGDGGLALDLAQGALRFVGGKLQGRQCRGEDPDRHHDRARRHRAVLLPGRAARTAMRSSSTARS